MKAYVESTIDTIQYAKTQFLNLFVPNETIRAPLQEIVDAQSQFARNVVFAGQKIADAISNQDAMKPYSEAIANFYKFAK